MPQTVVPSDSPVSSVEAVAAMFVTLRDGDADSRRAAATACPPRLRRVVAFMSANQAIRRVEDALTTQDASPEVTDSEEVRAAAIGGSVASHRTAQAVTSKKTALTRGKRSVRQARERRDIWRSHCRSPLPYSATD